MREVYSFFNGKLDINKDDYLLVAVSFGPDSMALLDIVKKTYKDNKIVCCHVHHNHRKESDKEALDLEKYCNKNNIIFEMMKIDKYKNDRFTEEEAREKRYKFFDEMIKKYKAKYLFMAHHGDDLVETVLMKIVRGSSIKGYTGIRLINHRKNYDIIRPFLFITKKDINEYCNRNKIPYAIDASNADNDYTRNRYRSIVLPFLKNENKNVHVNFLEFSNELQRYDNYFNLLTDKTYDEVVTNDKLNIEKLLEYDPIIIDRVIYKFLHIKYHDNINKINKKHVNSIIRLIKGSKVNGRLNMPDNNTLVRCYNTIYFLDEKKYNDYCFEINDYVNLNNGFVIKHSEELHNTSNYTACFIKDKISLPLYVRNAKEGDRIEVLGLNGSKKVHDIFINSKIPKEERFNYPVVVDKDDKVLWIPGLKKSKYDSSKQKKYDIILEYLKEVEDDSKQ